MTQLEIPRYLRGAFARFSLTFSRIVLILIRLGLVIGGVIGLVIGVTRVDILFICSSLIGTAIAFIFCYALEIIVVVVRSFLPSNKPCEESSKTIVCENGHEIEVWTGQAGSTIACPSCHSTTKIPSLSDLK